MKKQLLLSALLLAAVAATFVSCKKEDKEKSRQELIVGTWNLAALGLDANKNNQLEPAEQETLEAGDTNRQTFYANGSGESEYAISGKLLIKEAFAWDLSNNGQNLRVIQNNDTSEVIVTLLTQNRFEFYREENGARNIAVLTR